MKIRKQRLKQIATMLFLSAIASIILIVHGVLFDLNFSQICRLTCEGFLVTMPAVFIFLLVLEWVFDLSEETPQKEKNQSKS